MSATNDGGSAFPHSLDWGWNNKVKRYEAVGFHGMTLRDWFAGKALESCRTGEFDSTEQCARYCYAKADAMLAAREGGSK